MSLNLLAWGVYFIQSCFLNTSSVLFEKDGICETSQKIITEGQCCVCDPDDRTDRCCAFSRTYRSTPAFFCYGHVNDSEHMSSKKFDAHRLAATFKTILVVFALIFGIIGLWCLISPQSVVFNVVMVDEFRQQLGIQESKNSHAEDEKAHKETVTAMLNSAMSGLTSLFTSDNDDISKEDLAKIREQLGQVENNLVYSKPEAVSITEPTSLMGGAMLFYAAVCIYQLMMDIPQLIDLRNVYIHWLWYGCGLISIVSAASGHGRNMENSKFVTALIVFYVAGLVGFGFLERTMHGFFMKHGKITKYTLSDDEDDENILQK